MIHRYRRTRNVFRSVCVAAGYMAVGAVGDAGTTVAPFQQAVAEAAAPHPELGEFYRSNAYEAVWTGSARKFLDRRAALLQALEQVGDHAMPTAIYGVDAIKDRLSRIGSQRELGQIEVELSQLFLRYAHDLRSGVLNPAAIDPEIDREAPVTDGVSLLGDFLQADPKEFLLGLPPASMEYARLQKAKFTLDGLLAEGGWGPAVAVEALKPGQSGPEVVALRDRLVAMGYIRRSAVATYDAMLQIAVQRFQIDHGLNPDGVAGRVTMSEINRQVEDRIRSVTVALERERWMNFPRGERHVWVNLANFSAEIIDDSDLTFRTRSVIGQNTEDRRSPEFSDVMEYMEINPSWYVPRSIAENEFLPQMIETQGEAEEFLEIVDEEGEVVDRALIDWSLFNPETFPFHLRQAPGPTNALGFVKFMFPNRHNIYLHDTPEKLLFAHERRDFSHGCIRLDSPFEFAYEILSRQVEEPVSHFSEILESEEKTTVVISEPIPVHIVYRTAFTTPDGRLNFRRDIYGRDAKIFEALAEAGVVVAGVGT